MVKKGKEKGKIKEKQQTLLKISTINRKKIVLLFRLHSGYHFSSSTKKGTKKTQQGLNLI